MSERTISFIKRFHIPIPAEAGISLTPLNACHPIAIGSREGGNLLNPSQCLSSDSYRIPRRREPHLLARAMSLFKDYDPDEFRISSIIAKCIVIR
jgi:hypothetical protein